MDHYLDIRICPDPELSPHHLMNAMYAKLHRTLVGGRWQIAASFPEWRPSSLGHTLRLFGTRESLSALASTNWLRGMRDHTDLKAVSHIPEHTHHRVERVQAKSNVDRLRRRAMKRHGISQQQAIEQIPDTAAEHLKLPYLELQSSSTGHAFRLFIRQGNPGAQAIGGPFNTFGLSGTATVPYF